jgi:hypothetical protein
MTSTTINFLKSSLGILIRAIVSQNIINVGVDESLLRGVAQHYGMETDLLDYTTDVDVACAFADDTKDKQTAIVFATPLEGLKNYEVHLPHPSFFRIYNQNGLFIKQQVEDIREVNSRLVKVTFQTTGTFKAKRNGIAVDPYKDNPAISQMTHDLKKRIYDTKGNEELSNLKKDRSLIDACLKHLKNADEEDKNILVYWGERYEQIEYQFCRCMLGEQEMFIPEYFEPLAKHNAPFLKLFNKIQIMYLEMEDRDQKKQARYHQEIIKKAILDKY